MKKIVIHGPQGKYDGTFGYHHDQVVYVLNYMLEQPVMRDVVTRVAQWYCEEQGEGWSWKFVETGVCARKGLVVRIEHRGVRKATIINPCGVGGQIVMVVVNAYIGQADLEGCIITVDPDKYLVETLDGKKVTM